MMRNSRLFEYTHAKVYTNISFHWVSDSNWMEIFDRGEKFSLWAIALWCCKILRHNSRHEADKSEYRFKKGDVLLGKLLNFGWKLHIRELSNEWMNIFHQALLIDYYINYYNLGLY